MKKGEVGALMWIILGVLVLLAVIGVIIALKGKMFTAIGGLGGSLP